MTDNKMMPCPFCGHKPTFGYTKKTGCQLHGDPIQYVTLTCNKCEFKPSITGGCRYRGADTPKYENEARHEAIVKWNTRADLAAPTDDVRRDEVEYIDTKGNEYKCKQCGRMNYVATTQIIRAATARPSREVVEALKTGIAVANGANMTWAVNKMQKALALLEGGE